MCGEMAGNPLEAMALIALGFRTLSMAATAIGPVKTMIRSLDASAVAGYLAGDRQAGRIIRSDPSSKPTRGTTRSRCRGCTDSAALARGWTEAGVHD